MVQLTSATAAFTVGRLVRGSLGGLAVGEDERAQRQLLAGIPASPYARRVGTLKRTGSMTAETQVAMDEAGNTGENLLDAVQPVFALAGVHISLDHAEAAVLPAIARARGVELKFSRLRRSAAGRRNILQLLKDASVGVDAAAVCVAHKPWMVAGKLIDELVEPRMSRRGLATAWYGGGAAKNMADALYALGPRHLGPLYQELATAFVRLLRDYTDEDAAAFLRALSRARIASRAPQLDDLLAVMIDSEAELAEEFGDRSDALEPALPCLFWQAAHWSGELARPFTIVHDDSHTVRRYKNLFSGMAAYYATQPNPPTEISLGPLSIPLPTHLAGIDFDQSHRDARLQLADVLAGSAAHIYSVATGSREPDRFASELVEAGVGTLIQHAVGPGSDPG